MASKGKSMSASARLKGPAASDGKDGIGDRRQRAQRHHPRRHPGLQLLGLAGNGHEGAGRLVAGDLRRQLLGIAGGLNQIGQAE